MAFISPLRYIINAAATICIELYYGRYVAGNNYTITGSGISSYIYICIYIYSKKMTGKLPSTDPFLFQTSLRRVFELITSFMSFKVHLNYSNSWQDRVEILAYDGETAVIKFLGFHLFAISRRKRFHARATKNRIQFSLMTTAVIFCRIRIISRPSAVSNWNFVEDFQIRVQLRDENVSLLQTFNSFHELEIVFKWKYEYVAGFDFDILYRIEQSVHL